MDKKSICGFVLIGVIMFAFTFYQNRVYRKAAEAQAQLDSVARVEALKQAALDSMLRAQAMASDTTGAKSAQNQTLAAYKDSLLMAASAAEPSFFTLQNDKLELVFTTKGAQPYSARLKEYQNYDSTELYVFKPGMSDYAVSIYTGEYVKTTDFNFNIVASTDSSVVMRLPFAQGGYIEQKYVLEKDGYGVKNQLTFAGMAGVIPRNVSSFDLDYKMVIPRMEKGYKNESQYSKIAYYFDGDKKPDEAGRGRNASKKIDTHLSWFAYHQQFFSAIMRAPEEFASGSISVNFFNEDDESRNLMACESNMRVDFRPGNTVTVPFEFYFGPNHYNTLREYGHKYEKTIPLGGSLVGWFTRFVIIPLFDFFHGFIANFGIIILLMTLVIKLVVLPFAYKSYSSSAKMQVLRPEIEKINEKYPKQEDALKKQQATMNLYQRAGVSTMGGCLPMLLQFPILWAMFRFFPASIELRQQGFLWAEDLSAYDSIVDFGFRIPLLGDHLSLFAILMAASMWAYSKMNSAQMSGNDPNAQSMRFMSVWMMPIMMFFICNNLSAGLSYYYLLSNLVTMLETWIIKKYFVHPEAIRAKLKATEGKPMPKSKWQMRLEEAQKAQEAALRAQQKNNKR